MDNLLGQIAESIEEEKKKQTEEIKRITLRLQPKDYETLNTLSEMLGISYNQLLVHLIRVAGKNIEE